MRSNFVHILLDSYSPAYVVGKKITIFIAVHGTRTDASKTDQLWEASQKKITPEEQSRHYLHFFLF